MKQIKSRYFEMELTNGKVYGKLNAPLTRNFRFYTIFCRDLIKSDSQTKIIDDEIKHVYICVIKITTESKC